MRSFLLSVRARAAFTLIELLVVIAIIGILMSLLLPAVQSVREAARRTQCKNNLRQVAIAAHLYHDSLEALPPGWTGDNVDNSPGWGWASRLLPFMEQGNVYDSISFDQPIDHVDNAAIVTTVISTFLCPSDFGQELMDMEHTAGHGGLPHLISAPPVALATMSAEFIAARGNYSGVFGISEIEDQPDNGEGVFFRNSKIDFADIKDGLSHTLMIGERSSEFGGVTWLGVVNAIDEPMARILGSADHAPNDDGGHFEDFRSYHPSGANFAAADGSVHLINEAIDLTVYRAAATRHGREIPGDF